MISRVLLRRTLVLPILVAALAACSDDDEPTGQGAGSFTLGTPASAAVTLQAGQATTVTIPVTFTGNMNPVTLTADSVPTGVRVGFQPSVISNGTEVVTVSITANPDATIGTRTIKIIAKADDMTDQVARIAVTTTAVPSYTFTNPTTIAAPIEIQRTQSGTVTLTLNRAGFTGPVDIIPDALPAGVTVAPVLNVTGNTATITINTAANATATTGSFTVRATNPTMGDRTTTIRYRILAEPGVQIALAARNALQSAAYDTMFVTVNREGGFTGPVTVTLSNLPAGVTADPVTSATGSTVAIPLNIADDAAVGAKTVTATVSGTGIETKTTTAALTIASNLLTSGTAITIADARARNSILVYRVVVPSNNSTVNITLTGGSGDADVELYSDRTLSGDSYIDGSYEVDNAEDLTVTGLSAGTYYVAVWVWNAYANASLKATVTAGAPATSLRQGEAATSTTRELLARRAALRAARAAR